MPKIRILHIFTVMNRGGSESMIMNYYRQLNKDLIQFDFLVHRQQRGVFDDEIEAMGGKIYRLNPINPFFPKKYYAQLRKLLENKSKEYRIIHSHLNTFSFFPLKIAQEFKIPFRISHAHIALDSPKLSDLFSPTKGGKEFAKKYIKFYLKKRITRHTTHFFSCGIKAGNWLYGPDAEFKVLNNAINAKNFEYDETIALSYKKDLNLINDFTIGHIGRFTTQKNHSFLIDIFSEILKKQPKAKLLLVGDGPLRNEIEKYALRMEVAENVMFLGVRTDIPKLCMAMDYFVFPSHYEGLPVTLIETQCSGLKIMASDQITREVELTDNISFQSLEEPASVWATEILKQANYQRKNMVEKIIEEKYDIVENTKNLENFYLGLHNALL